MYVATFILGKEGGEGFFFFLSHICYMQLCMYIVYTTHTICIEKKIKRNETPPGVIYPVFSIFPGKFYFPDVLPKLFMLNLGFLRIQLKSFLP